MSSATRLNLWKLSTFPYRYVRFSRNVALKKPHIVKKHVKNFTVQCTPGFVSEMINDLLFEDDHSQFIYHYIMSYAINIIVSTTFFTAMNKTDPLNEIDD